MRVVTAPESIGPLELFLAGGITGCPDWQKVVVDELQDEDVVLYNPRRENFDVNDKSATSVQIAWEVRALQRADAVLFWFPADQVQPIALFELGRWSYLGKKLFVGADMYYPRLEDVLEQLRALRSNVTVNLSLRDLILDVKEWLQ